MCDEGVIKSDGLRRSPIAKIQLSCIVIVGSPKKERMNAQVKKHCNDE
jgi:hypothetical protein